MEISQYLKAYPLDDKPGELILFSTLRMSKAQVPLKTYEAALGGTLGEQEASTLARLGMLVSSRAEERRQVLDLPAELGRLSTGLSVTVVLNLDCNFACPYCYEGSMKAAGRTMDRETAARLIAFIEGRLRESHQQLMVDFYGGEPLLSLDLLREIAGRLKDRAAARGVAFHFTLITNGSLFTRRTAQGLLPLGLTGVRITLDGPEEIHNLRRPFKSGKGSFATLIRNIRDTCDLTRVALGGNFNRKTHQTFHRLLDDLITLGLTPDRIASIKFEPVLEHAAAAAQSPATAPCRSCAEVREPWVVEAGLALRQAILERGFATRPLRPALCAAHARDAYVIHYDGTIYRCPGFIGLPAFAHGDIRSAEEPPPPSGLPEIWRNETCEACTYLPLCFGGCRYLAFLSSGRTDVLDCQKAYYDRALGDLVRQDLRYGLTAQPPPASPGTRPPP